MKRVIATLFFLTTIALVNAQSGPQLPLTPAGEKLMAEYTATLERLRNDIAPALPEVDPGLKHPFMTAFQAQTAAEPYMMEKNEAFAKAVAHAVKASGSVRDIASDYLGSDKLDAKLVKAALIADATPRGLAAFAQQSEANKALIDQLLSDTPLMKQMLVAGGAKDGDYGLTMRIYTDIQKASEQAHSGILQRLALGTALEQSPAKKRGDDTPWDAVGRYMDYQKAYNNGELDPAFPIMTTWECRFITNDPYSNEEIDWFRMMTRNYRPDWLWRSYQGRARYLNVVHTVVGYSHTAWGAVPGSDITQLIAGGGQCGARAWIGRLAMRAFGIPTWGVRQPGHAALSHWTPEGWETHFGLSWNLSWWEDRSGYDFHLEAQARDYPKAFMRVLRARWTGAMLGDVKPDHRTPGTGGFWYALAKCEERVIVASGERPRVIPNDKELAKQFGPTEAQKVQSARTDRSTAKISVDRHGRIQIPAVAFSEPKEPGHGVAVMNSFLGGMQLNYAGAYYTPGLGWKNDAPALVYVVDAPKAGQYNLFMKVVTVKLNEEVTLAVNDAKTPTMMVFPFTAGRWQEIKPIEITLKEGRNVLRFDHTKKQLWGVTIKHLTLAPVFVDK